MVLLWILGAVCALVGVVGTVAPAIPGPPLVWLGLLLAAWAEDFRKVGWLPLAIAAALALAALVVDLVSGALGVRRAGASRLAVVGSAVGGVVGLFFGIPGAILGPFFGAAVGEYWARRDALHAARVGAVAWLGIAIAAAAKLALVFSMLACFAAAYAL